MGIVRRQSALNLIWSYLGVGLGYVNKIILFAEILTKGQFGLLELLLTFMTIGTELALLGTPKIITRFFPHHHKHPFREGSLMFFLTVYSLVGFVLLSIVLLLFKPMVVEAYEVNSPLFAADYLYIIPITFAYLLYRVLAGISASMFRTVIPMMAFEVALKLVMTVLILGYYFQWFGFDTLVLLYVLAHFLPAIIVIADIKGQHLKWKANWKMFRSRQGRVMIQYGLYSTLSDATAILVQRVDMIIIGLYLGEGLVGTYAIAVYFGSLIAKPGRSINSILGPLISTRLKERKMEEVEMLYHKTALNNLLIGGILLAGMVVNIGPFFELFPKHEQAIGPAIILGGSLLLNMFTGPHRILILNSRLFRYDLWANIVLLGMAILLDLWLVPLYGLMGAAVATFIVTILYNFVTMLYVRHHLEMFPLSRKNIVSLLILVLITLIGLAIPGFGHPIVTMALRSLVVGGLFVGMIFWLKPSPDLTELLMMPIRKLRKK